MFEIYLRRHGEGRTESVRSIEILAHRRRLPHTDNPDPKTTHWTGAPLNHWVALDSNGRNRTKLEAIRRNQITSSLPMSSIGTARCEHQLGVERDPPLRQERMS
jgi:hypothetical protein